MRRRVAFLLLLGPAACGEPEAGTGDLPRGTRRLAVEAMPTTGEIASACFVRESESCRDDPETHSYCEPPEGHYLVSAPACSRVPGDESAVDCRFGATVMPWGAPEESYRRLRPRDYDPVAGRFVRVTGPGGPRWLAATYCRRPAGE